MIKNMLLAVVFTTFLGAVMGQAKFGVYGLNVEERASTRIGYWRTDVNAGIGETVVSYGRPVWKPEYSQQIDKLTVGKMWRMGNNYWTLLDTTLPVRVGDADVVPGQYYLAVRRSEDGTRWELVFIDPAQSRAKGLDAYDVGTRPDEIPILFSVPLEFAKTTETVEKLTIVFSLNKDSKTDGTMRLTWGDFSLTTPVGVKLPVAN